jgi:hypothetical protein
MMQPALFDTPRIATPQQRQRRETDLLLERMRQRAGAAFREAADACMLRQLQHGAQLTGEQLTDGCKAHGIVPPCGLDDRAYGPVFRRMASSGRIAQVGTAPRAKGHGSAGGRVWARA